LDGKTLKLTPNKKDSKLRESSPAKAESQRKETAKELWRAYFRDPLEKNPSVSKTTKKPMKTEVRLNENIRRLK
jgi:hypothetical protein